MKNYKKRIGGIVMMMAMMMDKIVIHYTIKIEIKDVLNMETHSVLDF
jgi:hypothetical protein